MKRYVLVALVIVFLAGCGGGNGSDESGNAPANTGSIPAPTNPGGGHIRPPPVPAQHIAEPMPQ